MQLEGTKLALIGLGYVGLPLGSGIRPQAPRSRNPH